MKHILLIRHAESTNNALNDRLEAVSAGDIDLVRTRVEEDRDADCELSPLGFDQARMLGSALALRNPPNPVLVSSPMRRALQTAEAINASIALGTGRFLCQGNLFEVGGAYFGEQAVPTTTPSDLETRYRVTCRDMDARGWYAGRTGRESSDEATQRVDQVVAWLEQFLRDPEPVFETAIIVSHGDLMSRWLRRWIGVPIGRGLAFMHHNTGITSLSWDKENGVLMHGINDTSHLPGKMRTGESEGWWNCVLPDLQVTTFENVNDVPLSVSTAMDELRARYLWSVERRADDFADTNGRSMHVVARSGGQVVGCALFDPVTNRLRQMVVDPQFRRHGVGRRLVRGVEAAARRRGSTSLAVHAWKDSAPFYERAGFQPSGEIRADAEVAWQPMSLGL